VVASLWDVPDASTAELMERFYAGLQEGRSTADARRSAQTAALRRPSSSHPYHWAGFQLSGDWR
jgi:CHAT domain-containing protein